MLLSFSIEFKNIIQVPVWMTEKSQLNSPHYKPESKTNSQDDKMMEL